MLRRSPVILLNLMLPACTYTYDSVNIPQGRFLSPENEDHFSFGASAGSEATISEGNLKLGDGGQPFVNIALAQVDLLLSQSQIGLKWQFYGTPKGEFNEPGFSLAVAGQRGTAISKPADDFREVTIRANWWDLTLLGGFRYSSATLFYIGTGFTPYRASIDVKNHVSDLGTDYSSGVLRGESTSILGGLIYSPGGTFYIQLEPGYSRAWLQKSSYIRRSMLGLTLGWQL